MGMNGKPLGDEAKELIRKISARKAQLGLSARELALRSGCSQPHISQLLNHRISPSLEIAIRLARAVGLRLELTEEEAAA